MAMLENKTKENPKLEQNKLSDGRISLYRVLFPPQIIKSNTVKKKYLLFLLFSPVLISCSQQKKV